MIKLGGTYEHTLILLVLLLLLLFANYVYTELFCIEGKILISR